MTRSYGRGGREGARDEALCTGFIVGVSDAMANRNVVFNFRACVPEPATIRQVRDVAIRHLEQNPDRRHLGASSLVAKALSEAFPCR